MTNRYIISGGGTGGHIFPALSIAQELKQQLPHAEILFVGAEGKMEMQRVPAAGFPIVGLPIRGMERRRWWKNIGVALRLLKSLWMARKTIKEFQPNAVIGVGGYASGPTLWMAQQLKIPTLIQEQNSYAGVANKLLAKRAMLVCVAYPRMERFFAKEKIILTGNPVRAQLFAHPIDPAEALNHFNLSPHKPVVLLIGGSLGAGTLNQSVKQAYHKINTMGIQLLWQCGGFYRKEMEEFVKQNPAENIHLIPFIDRMDYAYAAANIIVSRAGAGSLSELCLVGKPAILVPSPNVAEDHQTHNALSLVNRGAAIRVSDADAKQQLFDRVKELIENRTHQQSLAKAIAQLALPNAAQTIVKAILSIGKK